MSKLHDHAALLSQNALSSGLRRKQVSSRRKRTIDIKTSIEITEAEADRLRLPITYARALKLTGHYRAPCTLVIPGGRRVATSLSTSAGTRGVTACWLHNSWLEAADALNLLPGDVLHLTASPPLSPLVLHASKGCPVARAPVLVDLESSEDEEYSLLGAAPLLSCSP